jgi:hypothetical protein
MDEKLRRLVHDLRCAVSQALADSIEVGEALRGIRREGWSLYLVVDRQQQRPPEGCYEVPARTVAAGEEANFRIDGRDLSFLRSIGIDPTRRIRTRRA